MPMCDWSSDVALPICTLFTFEPIERNILHILIALLLFQQYCNYRGFPGGSDGKESACNAGDPGSILGSGRSPGGGHGNPPQYSCLENAYGQRATDCGITESKNTCQVLNKNAMLDKCSFYICMRDMVIAAIKQSFYSLGLRSLRCPVDSPDGDR